MFEVVVDVYDLISAQVSKIDEENCLSLHSVNLINLRAIIVLVWTGECVRAHLLLGNISYAKYYAEDKKYRIC